MPICQFFNERTVDRKVIIGVVIKIDVFNFGIAFFAQRF
jgi:hypothetical protein